MHLKQHVSVHDENEKAIFSVDIIHIPRRIYLIGKIYKTIFHKTKIHKNSFW